MTLDDLQARTQQLVGLREATLAKAQHLEAEIAHAEAEAHLLGHVTAAFDRLIDVVSRDSLAQTEQLVSYGLRAVFDDLQLTFVLEVETKRGVQRVTPKLVDGSMEARSILDSFGGGPAALVSFLLRLLVCRRLQLAPLLLLDEPFTFLSEQYVDKTATLLRELADAAGVTLVLVTHDRRYLASATRAYEACDSPTGGTFRAVV